MKKNVDKLLYQIVKYDLISGLFIALIIGIISTLVSAGSYLVGISVAAMNFFIGGYIISKYLGKNKQVLIAVSYFLRLGFIVIIMIPFVKNERSLIFFIIGFLSHYVILLISFSIKNRKGSV